VNPARTRQVAIGQPMLPTPTKPISITWRPLP
jgi:hypothetical protein